MDILTPIIFLNAAAVFVYMTLWFIYAYVRRRLDVVDTAWGGGFIVIAMMTYLQYPSRLTALVGVMVTLWGLRLILHIYTRNRGKANDERYDELTKSWNKNSLWFRAYISIFLGQGVLVMLVSLPIILAGSLQTEGFNVISIVGVALWVIGFGVEIVADRQLSVFLRDKNKTQTVMNKGLWRYSRHPNYFGEVTTWWGIGILVASTTDTWWLPLIGPLVITYLIGFVSGIPPLEKRHRHNPAYADYNRRTSVFIPLPPRS